MEYNVTFPSLSPINKLFSIILRQVMFLISGFNVLVIFFFVSKNKSWNLIFLFDLYEDKIRKESLSKLGKKV